MGLETGTYISDLVSTNPTASDAKSQGDDHIRLLKSTIKATFPNVSGAVTPTHTELNYVDGVTSAIQTQIDAKAPIASPALTGTPTAPTATVGTNTTQIATTAFVAATAFSSVLPAQSGALNKVLSSDGTNADWKYMFQRDTRTSNTILGAADVRKYIEVTTGGFTQTLTAAATLGEGWWVIYKNNDTSAVTIDPNGAETIDGATTLVMYAGESRLIVCTGSAFHTTVLNGFTHTFSAGTTFTRPPHYKYFLLECWGGGGSGGRGSALAPAGGGGGGAYNQRLVTAAQLGASILLTVGAGGLAQTSADTAGNVGGDTSVGSLVVAYGGGAGGTSLSGGHGGGGGGTMSAGQAGNSGGNGGIPRINVDNGMGSGASATAAAGDNGFGGGGGGSAAGGGTGGGYSHWGGGGGGSGRDATSGGTGGNSFMGGGGGGGAANSTAGGAGGTSIGGGNGGAGGIDSVAATSGSTPSGGGGGNEDGNSGAGGDGQIRITGIL